MPENSNKNQQILHITEEKRRELEKELEYRKGELRNKILKSLAIAKSRGDLRENAEYDAAKEEQQENESKILEIEYILKNCHIISKDKSASDYVCMLSSVTIENTETKEKMTVTIVSPLESDFSKGKISIDSPIGSALMHKAKGDIAEVSLPNGKMVKYKIIEIE